MIKITRIIAAVFIVTMLISALPRQLEASSLTVGASTWYVWWDDPDNEIDPGLMYGPVASIGFGGKWSLSSVFLTGKFDFETGMPGTSMVARRIDWDSSLSYSLGRYVSVFAGYKYMGYVLTLEAGGYSDEMKMFMTGPGAGLSLMVPIADSLYLIGNFSGMYLFGLGRIDDEQLYGMNAQVSLAYRFDSPAVTLVLGGRYQRMFDTDYWDNYFLFRGITFSAMYTFDFSGSE